jgi:hypothetical protein
MIFTPGNCALSRLEPASAASSKPFLTGTAAGHAAKAHNFYLQITFM